LRSEQLFAIGAVTERCFLKAEVRFPHKLLLTLGLSARAIRRS
jgi:hypothetical protein